MPKVAVRRPSEAEVEEALFALKHAPPSQEQWAQRTLRAALAPREVWPAKEVAACLRVQVSNLRTTSGLPAPCQVFDRPTATNPDKKMRLWWRDEIEAHPMAYRTIEKEGG